MLRFSSIGSGSIQFITIMSVVGLIAGIVIFCAFSKSDAEELKTMGAGNFRSFFSFDRLIIGSILKLFYAISACEILCVGFSIGVICLADWGAIGFLAFLVCIMLVALLELLCRMFFESLILNIKITENTTIIRNLMTGNPNTSVGFNGMGGMGANSTPGTYQGGPGSGIGNYTGTTTISSYGAGSGPGTTWQCAKCGKINNGGTFCAGCGNHK